MKAFKFVAVIALVAAAFGGGYLARSVRPATTSAHRKVLYYVDPMHPAYISDKPGLAPDCGMQLEPVYADETGIPRPAATQKVLYYRDAQAPAYRSDKPGLNPETGNTLEPVYADAAPSD